MRAFNYISSDWIPISYFLKDTEWFQADFIGMDGNHLDVIDGSITNSFSSIKQYLDDFKNFCLPCDFQQTTGFDWALLPENHRVKYALLLMESGCFRIVPKNLLVYSIGRAKWNANFRDIPSPEDNFPKKLKFIKIFNCTKPVVNTAYTLFLKAYTPELLEILEKMNIPALDLDPRFLNWLNGYPLRVEQKLSEESKEQLSADNELARTRLQAFAAYPLISLIYCSGEIKWDKKIKIFQAIDNRSSLAQVFQQTLDLPLWLVKKINGLKPDDIFYMGKDQINRNKDIQSSRDAGKSDWIESLYSLHDTQWSQVHLNAFNNKYKINHLLKGAKLLKPDHLPKNKDEWSNFASIQYYINQTFGLYSAELLQSIGSQWTTQMLTSITQCGYEDVLKNIKRNLTLPTFEFFGGDTLIVDIITNELLLENKTIGSVIKMCDWWHAHHAAIMLKLQHQFPLTDQTLGAWPALCKDFTTSSGYKIIALTQTWQLEKEGSTMGHCVGTYDTQCLFSPTHILSIQTPDGKSSSTARFDENDLLDFIKGKPTRQSPIPGLIEHRKQNNREPDEEDRLALNEWWEAVKSNVIQIDFNHLQRERLKRVGFRSGYIKNHKPLYAANRIEAIQATWQEHLVCFDQTDFNLLIEEIRFACTEHPLTKPKKPSNLLIECFKRSKWLKRFLNLFVASA